MLVHKSIRITEEQNKQIAATCRDTSEVIREALDLYFQGVDHRPLNRDIVGEMLKQHVADYHTESTESTKNESTENTKSTEYRVQTEHIVSTDARSILSFILSELQAGREPLLPDVAQKFSMTTQTLSKSLTPLDIRAQETKRQGKAGRYFTQTMRPQIEKILGSGYLEPAQREGKEQGE